MANGICTWASAASRLAPPVAADARPARRRGWRRRAQPAWLSRASAADASEKGRRGVTDGAGGCAVDEQGRRGIADGAGGCAVGEQGGHSRRG